MDQDLREFLERDIRILVYPHPLLSQEIHELTTWPCEGLEKAIERMWTIMTQNKGRGLAAPQVGLRRRIFLMQTKNRRYVCINPAIERASAATCIQSEGCLSLPGIQLPIERPRQVNVSYSQPDGTRINRQQLAGETARIFQHEFNHLQGVMITDLANGATHSRMDR